MQNKQMQIFCLTKETKQVLYMTQDLTICWVSFSSLYDKTAAVLGHMQPAQPHISMCLKSCMSSLLQSRVTGPQRQLFLMILPRAVQGLHVNLGLCLSRLAKHSSFGSDSSHCNKSVITPRNIQGNQIYDILVADFPVSS